MISDMNRKEMRLYSVASAPTAAKAEPATPPMFHRNSKASGFTLIELMVVVAIIAGVAVLAMPYMNNRSPGTKRFLREFTVLSRELHTRAKLNGVIYRLVIDMGEQGDGL